MNQESEICITTTRKNFLWMWSKVEEAIDCKVAYDPNPKVMAERAIEKKDGILKDLRIELNSILGTNQ